MSQFILREAEETSGDEVEFIKECAADTPQEGDPEVTSFLQGRLPVQKVPAKEVNIEDLNYNTVWTSCCTKTTPIKIVRHESDKPMFLKLDPMEQLEADFESEKKINDWAVDKKHPRYEDYLKTANKRAERLHLKKVITRTENPIYAKIVRGMEYCAQKGIVISFNGRFRLYQIVVERKDIKRTHASLNFRVDAEAKKVKFDRKKTRDYRAAKIAIEKEMERQYKKAEESDYDLSPVVPSDSSQVELSDGTKTYKRWAAMPYEDFEQVQMDFRKKKEVEAKKKKEAEAKSKEPVAHSSKSLRDHDMERKTKRSVEKRRQPARRGGKRKIYSGSEESQIPFSEPEGSKSSDSDQNSDSPSPASGREADDESKGQKTPEKRRVLAKRRGVVKKVACKDSEVVSGEIQEEPESDYESEEVTAKGIKRSKRSIESDPEYRISDDNSDPEMLKTQKDKVLEKPIKASEIADLAKDKTCKKHASVEHNAQDMFEELEIRDEVVENIHGEISEDKSSPETGSVDWSEDNELLRMAEEVESRRPIVEEQVDTSTAPGSSVSSARVIKMNDIGFTGPLIFPSYFPYNYEFYDPEIREPYFPMTRPEIPPAAKLKRQIDSFHKKSTFRTVGNIRVDVIRPEDDLHGQGVDKVDTRSVLLYMASGPFGGQVIGVPCQSVQPLIMALVEADHSMAKDTVVSKKESQLSGIEMKIITLIKGIELEKANLIRKNGKLGGQERIIEIENNIKCLEDRRDKVNEKFNADMAAIDFNKGNTNILVKEGKRYYRMDD